MRTLNAAVIGCGALAQGTHLRHLNELDGVRLRWACDVNSETLSSVVGRFKPENSTNTYEEVVADPDVDAIVLATSQDVRVPIIRAAAEAGMGVYTEKPMAHTLDEMREIEKIVDDTGIAFCVGHNRRSAPAMKYARELAIRQQRDPAPCAWRFDRNSQSRERLPEEDQAYFVIRINDDILSWKPWALTDIMMASGPMLFEMTHFTDIACWFMDSKPVRVTAVGHVRSNQSVVIQFESGSLATILMTLVGTFGYPKELYEFYAHGGAVVMDHFVEVRTGGMDDIAPRATFDLYSDPFPDVSDGGGIRDYYAKHRAAEQKTADSGTPDNLLQFSPGVDKGHKEHLRLFLEAVRGNGGSPAPCAESVLATRVAFAAVESLKTGVGVEV